MLERALTVPDYNPLLFFSQCQKLCENPKEDYGIERRERPVISPGEAQFCEDIKEYSWRYFFTTINLLKVMRKIIHKKTQRIIVVAELPSDTLKKALSVYQKDIWETVLDIFKDQVPFNGRKWRYSNMDLVSAIYLNCKIKLREEWLVGGDVAAEVEDAYAQEVAIRALSQFYNDRKYSKEIKDPDFFALELEALSLDS